MCILWSKTAKIANGIKNLKGYLKNFHCNKNDLIKFQSKLYSIWTHFYFYKQISFTSKTLVIWNLKYQNIIMYILGVRLLPIISPCIPDHPSEWQGRDTQINLLVLLVIWFFNWSTRDILTMTWLCRSSSTILFFNMQPQSGRCYINAICFLCR